MLNKLFKKKENREALRIGQKLVNSLSEKYPEYAKRDIVAKIFYMSDEEFKNITK